LALFPFVSFAQPQPELVVESFHSSRVTRVVYSPDSQLLITGGKDGRIRVFAAASMRLAREWNAHTSAIQSMALHSNVIATTADDAVIRLWDYNTGTQQRSLTGHLTKVTSLAFSPDGSQLASASTDGSLRVWNAVTGAQQRTLRVGLGDSITNLATEIKLEFNAVAFLPSGNQLIAGGTDKRITIWDLSTGRIGKSVTGFTSPITAVAISPDRQWFLSGTQDGSVKIHRFDGAATVFDVYRQNLPVHSFAFSPDARWMAIGMASSNVERRSAAEGKTLRAFKGLSADVHDVAFSPDGRQFATGGDGAFPAIYDIAAQRTRLTLLNRRALDLRLVDPDDEWMLPTTLLGDAVAFVELAWNRLQDYRRITDRRGTPAVMAWRALDAAGAEAWAASPSNVSLKQTAAAAPFDISTPAPSTAGVFREDGKLLAFGDREGNVRFIDLSSHAELQTLKAFDIPIATVAFNTNGNLLAAASATGIAIWDLAARRQTATIPTSNATQLAFSPDARILLSESSEGKRLWQVSSGKPLLSFTFLNEGRDWVAAAPNGLFDASSGSMRNTGWRFPEDKLGKSPLELFFNEFYYPGLLKSILAGESPQVSTNLTNVDRRQPVIRLALAKDPAGSTDVSLTLSVDEAPAGPNQPRGSGARDLRVFRNGILVKVWPGEIVAPGARTAQFTADLRLLSGENVFTAYAFNSANIKSPDAALTVRAGARIRREPALHLLMIGVSTYANPQFNLNFAVKDIDAVSAELRSSAGVRQFSSLQPVRLADRDATKANILLALKLLGGAVVTNRPAALANVKPAEPQDGVLIYFAGHGTAYQNHFFLIPHDLGFQGPRRSLTAATVKPVLDHSISDRELEEALLSLDVNRLALIIDACHSGQVLDAEERRRGPLNTKGLAQLAYEKGMYVLAAAQSFQAALEAGNLGHGYLTYSLLQALRGDIADDRPQDGAISMQEWLDYGVFRVPELHRGGDNTTRNLIVRKQQTEEVDVQTPRVFYRRDLDESGWILRLLQPKP